jgi:hypothetical protein
MEVDLDAKKLKKQRFIFSSAIIGLFYMFISSSYGSLNPLDWNKIEKEKLQREQERMNYEIKVDSVYDNFLKNLPSFKDSLDFYLRNNLPIKLKEPSLEQKEEVIKKNNLEKSLM